MGSVYMGGGHRGCSPGVLGGAVTPPFLPCPETPSVGADEYFSPFYNLADLHLFLSDRVSKQENS